MKRFWQIFLAIVAAVPMADTAEAQSSLSGLINGYAGNIEGGAVVDQGYLGNNVEALSPSPFINDTVSDPVISQPLSGDSTIGQPTFETLPIFVPGESIAPRPSRAFSLFGVNLRRDYEDGVSLGVSTQERIFTDDVSHGNFSGIGASLTTRKLNGSGREVRYWGLDDSDSEDFGSATTLGLLSGVFHSPLNRTVGFLFDASDSLSLDRTTRINNLEVNLLRNASNYKSRFGEGNFELLAGFRIFQFDEDLQYAGNSTRFFPSRVLPNRLEYAVETENLLTGFQVGLRNEVSLGRRLRLSGGGNIGVFNNRINTRQRIFDDTGFEPTASNSSRPFNFQDQKDDVAVLGEFNVGLILPVSKRLRLNAGYKIIGVAGVALAADQIPSDFRNERELETANSNGSLFLHGFTYGAEVSF